MNTAIPSPAGEQKPKGRFKKFALVFLAILVVSVGSAIALNVYEFKRGERGVRELAEALKRAEKEDYERALADTYGGKTPQETLRLYIEAVERGDYELASKYFIGDYQQKELEKLQAIRSTGNLAGLSTYINFLKNAEPLKSSLEDEKFVMEAKVKDETPSIFARFKKYPNGIWKIIEI